MCLCALSWNTLPVIERNIQEYSKFKNVQKKELIGFANLVQILSSISLFVLYEMKSFVIHIICQKYFGPICCL